MSEDELRLLMGISAFCKKDPSFLTHVINAGLNGIQQEVHDQRVRASDMECLASMAMQMAGDKRVTKKTKESFERLVELKLQKYADKGSFNWEWLKDRSEES